jgi:hypothetical protein
MLTLRRHPSPMTRHRGRRIGQCGAFAAALVLASPATADEDAGLVRLFADCAGRYSAFTEHLWLVDGPASEQAAQRRDAFADLTEAALPLPPDTPSPLPRPGRSGTETDENRVLGWRVAAKAAQRHLHDAAAFGRDPTHRARSAEVAARHLAQCDRLLAGH